MKFILLALLLIAPVIAGVSRKALSEADKKAVLEVLQKNDALFNAFLAKDGKKVEKTAFDLNAALVKAKAPSLTEVKKQSFKLLNIKAANPNDLNLVQYEQVLNPLLDVVKGYDVGKKYNIFHCPMVKKSWLQDIDVNKDVRNVYAMEMLECGSQETTF